MIKGINRKIRMLCFVLINNVLWNLWCVWIEFLTLEHILLRCVDSEKDILRRSLTTVVREYLVVWKIIWRLWWRQMSFISFEKKKEKKKRKKMFTLCRVPKLSVKFLLVNWQTSFVLIFKCVIKNKNKVSILRTCRTFLVSFLFTFWLWMFTQFVLVFNWRRASSNVYV